MKKILALVLSLLMVLALSAPTLALAVAPRSGDIGYINVSNVNLRTGPGTSYPSIAQLARYTDVEISDGSSTPTWYYVIVLDGVHAGKSGYVSAQYVTIYDA